MTAEFSFLSGFWNDHFERKPQRECVYEQVTEVDCDVRFTITSWHDTIKYHCDGRCFYLELEIFKEEY